MRWRHGCLVVMVSLMLCACHASVKPAPQANPEGNASWHLVNDANTPRYQLSLNQVASGASIISRTSPIYPGDELARCPPSVDVQAQLVVDETGHISDVRVSDEAQADPSRHHYIDAVRAAAKQWTFSPLEIDNWVDNPDGTRHLQSKASKPFSLVYAFHFACQDGRTSTSVGKTTAP
jgi:hypothetical protein